MKLPCPVHPLRLDEQEIRGGDKDLRGFAFILTTIWTVLVFAPLWLLNLFGGRDISKVIEDSQKINQ